MKQEKHFIMQDFRRCAQEMELIKRLLEDFYDALMDFLSAPKRCAIGLYRLGKLPNNMKIKVST
jgi:hypothetical protein